MPGRVARLFSAAGAVLVTAPAAVACPLCGSDVGRQVRAGIFDEHFATTLLAVLLPFPVLAAVVAFIHYGPPWTGPTDRTTP